jgi:hypothetical protein
VSSTTRAGKVGVVYSAHSELFINTESLYQSTFALGSRESEARFGSALHARTFPSGGVLAVGIPHDNAGSIADAGRLHVYRNGGALLEGGHVGLRKSRAFSQDSSGVPSAAEKNDRFGFDVLLLDVNADKKPDLIASSPDESVGSLTGAGAVYTARDVLGVHAWSLFTQDSAGVGSAAEKGDRFGASVG